MVRHEGRTEGVGRAGKWLQSIAVEGGQTIVGIFGHANSLERKKKDTKGTYIETERGRHVFIAWPHVHFQGAHRKL